MYSKGNIVNNIVIILYADRWWLIMVIISLMYRNIKSLCGKNKAKQNKKPRKKPNLITVGSSHGGSIMSPASVVPTGLVDISAEDRWSQPFFSQLYCVLQSHTGMSHSCCKQAEADTAGPRSTFVNHRLRKSGSWRLKISAPKGHSYLLPRWVSSTNHITWILLRLREYFWNARINWLPVLSTLVMGQALQVLRMKHICVKWLEKSSCVPTPTCRGWGRWT